MINALLASMPLGRGLSFVRGPSCSGPEQDTHPYSCTATAAAGPPLLVLRSVHSRSHACRSTCSFVAPCRPPHLMFAPKIYIRIYMYVYILMLHASERVGRDHVAWPTSCAGPPDGGAGDWLYGLRRSGLIVMQCALCALAAVLSTCTDFCAAVSRCTHFGKNIHNHREWPACGGTD